jgi:hypothetical protein
LNTESSQTSSRGTARTILAVVAMIGALVLATLVTASAQGGGGVSPTGAKHTGSQGGDRYDRMWKDFKRKDRRWARRTSRCEAGGDPQIHGGGGQYHGAFQFVKSTWESSPKSRGSDPHRFRWKVQAVVAVKLKHRDGAGHWPVFG